VKVNAYCAGARPMEVEGLCVFDKRVILFGSEGSARIFSSQLRAESLDQQMLEQSNLPTAVVEAVDPIVLNVRLAPVDSCCGCDLCQVPTCVCGCFESQLCDGEQDRVVLVTLGQFSIIRLERDSQLLIPVLDYCMPDKDCTGQCGTGSEDPCQLFRSIAFPVDEFFPPSALETACSYGETKRCCSER